MHARRLPVKILELALWNLHGSNSVTLLLAAEPCLLQIQRSQLVLRDTSTQKMTRRNDVCHRSQSERFHPNHQPERWETRHSRNIDCSNSKGQKITTSISAASCELRLHSTAGNSLACVSEVLLMHFTQLEERDGWTSQRRVVETTHTDTSWSSSHAGLPCFLSHSDSAETYNIWHF